jgi:3-deoxy-7-phosphoheptulonate synthase
LRGFCFTPRAAPAEDNKQVFAMSPHRLENINVLAQEVLTTPESLKASLPVTKLASDTVHAARAAVQAILDGDDHRLLVVVGPCSIHDTRAALEYAGQLGTLASEVDDTLLLVMRAYFEKPRTTVGWKGLVNDPHLDDSFQVAEGLGIARQLLLDICELGVPLATEALDPITPQYLHDLIAWAAIGARTTESQTHREMASGLSCAVGFKNGTDGSLDVAINALQSVSEPHRFLGINQEGRVSVIHTRGNPYAHVVLRGGAKPNYDSVSVALCEQALADIGVRPNVMVDCSHANSSKDPALQPLVAEDVARQILEGNQSIIGLMIESNLNWGSQSIPADRAELQYGVSVTDACIDWKTTEELLKDMRAKLMNVLPKRRSNV